MFEFGCVCVYLFVCGWPASMPVSVRVYTVCGFACMWVLMCMWSVCKCFCMYVCVYVLCAPAGVFGELSVCVADVWLCVCGRSSMWLFVCCVLFCVLVLSACICVCCRKGGSVSYWSCVPVMDVCVGLLQSSMRSSCTHSSLLLHIASTRPCWAICGERIIFHIYNYTVHSRKGKEKNNDPIMILTNILLVLGCP